MIEILYSRRSLCMGDDVYNGLCRIELPDGAVLGDLVETVLRGGNGNERPVPMTSEIGWILCADIGILADVTADKKRVTYRIADENAALAPLGIRWVFGEREGVTPDLALIGRSHFA